jgi:signal transduction histidine kinase/FixJ family two-component response regulator
VRLTTKINWFFLISLLVAMMICTLSFFIMLRSDKTQTATKTAQRVDGILDGQMLMFTRDLSRGEIEMAKLRANLIEAAYREEGVKIELTDPAGAIIYAAPELARLERVALGSFTPLTLNWKIVEDHVVSARPLNFNGVDLGVMSVGALLRPASRSFFQNTIIVVFLIISAMSMAGMILTRSFFQREVLRPLGRLLNDVRGVHRFISGQQDTLPAVPEKLSAEMRILYDSLWQNSRDLRAAVDDRSRAIARLEREQALSRTMQMLAHDVRKPFSMFKIILDSLAAANDFTQMKSFVRQARRDVLEALQSVEGMIQDIMEIGSHVPPVREPEDPARLIETAINQVFRLDDKAQISLLYKLHHTTQILGDGIKLNRVLVNIIHNASDAMKGRGSITIQTEDHASSEGRFILLSIANDGPPIPPEAMPHLFDAFFTSGKKGGTGLGLAIAHRIVTAHGGQIWADNENGLVKFHLTLPAAASVPASSSVVFPLSSQEVFETNQFAPPSQSSSANADETSLEQEFTSRIGSAKLRVLIVDDEPLYRSAIEGQIRQRREISDSVDIQVARNAEEALRLATESNPDIIIQDIDLGRGESDGFEIVRSLREHGSKAHICIHSNRGVFQYQEQSFRSGANAFLPKPMSRIHLLKLLTGVLSTPDLQRRVLESRAETPAEDALVILVEDSALVRMAWKQKIPDARFHLFACPEDLLSEASTQPELMKQARIVVIDNNYGDLSAYSGVDLATTLREQTGAALFLYSEIPLQPMPNCFDAYLPKQVYTREELLALVPKTRDSTEPSQ